jgi:hypothetical protein
MPARPRVPVRDWLAWAAVWTLALQSPMWVAVGIDSVQERSNPTMEATPVAGWVPVLGTVLAVAVPLAVVLSVLGADTVRPRRAGLLLGGAVLFAAALAWSGFPDGDTGEWYVVLSVLAGACALGAAALPDADGAETHGATGVVVALVGAALVLAGVLVMVTCWRGGTYWYWRGGSTPTYRAGLVLGGMQVLLGLLARSWVREPSSLVRGGAVVLAALLGAGALAKAILELVEMGILYRWEEDESAWATATPLLVAGVGLLATSVGAWRRRGDLLGLSLAGATTAGLLGLWQSPWGSVMS